MPKRPAGVAHLRQLVRERVDETSIRAVAAQIGMSASGLHVFLNGSRPHPSTVQLVTRWASRLGEQGVPDDRDVDAAIALLVQYVRSAPTKDEQRARVDRITRAIQ